MNTILSSIDSPTTFADWLGEALGLVQRVDARLRGDAPRTAGPRLRHGRQVLTDHQCLRLAGLAAAAGLS